MISIEEREFEGWFKRTWKNDRASDSYDLMKEAYIAGYLRGSDNEY